MPKWKNEETGEVIDYIPPRTGSKRDLEECGTATQAILGFGESALKQVFSSLPGKTLKLKVKTGETLERSVRAAYRYVSNPQQEYSRIEFKYGDCYIVVARLKEEKD